MALDAIGAIPLRAASAQRKGNYVAKYKVSNLNAKTPTTEQSKLETSLRAMSGVESVTLHPEDGDFSIFFRREQEPQKGELEAAVSMAGFSLGSSKAAFPNKA